MHQGSVPILGCAWSVPILCPDNRRVQLCLQEIIWGHQIGVWEEIPALGWAALYKERGGCVFFC